MTISLLQPAGLEKVHTIISQDLTQGERRYAAKSPGESGGIASFDPLSALSARLTPAGRERGSRLRSLSELALELKRPLPPSFAASASTTTSYTP